MRTTIVCGVSMAFLLVAACAGEPENIAAIEVNFEWQQIDKGATDNPELRLTGVPEGTTRFLVTLVDLNLKGFDHGSGYADNDGTGIIARGAVKGSYNGPDPPFPSVRHTYEITVTAYDAGVQVIGEGKQAKVFRFSDEKK